MHKKRTGKLVTNDVRLMTHELGTVDFFLEKGYDIELLVPSNTPRNKNADFLMSSLCWEMKCPMGRSLSTIEHLFRKAACQSENIVFDLRYCKSDEHKVVALLGKLFLASKKVRRIKVILRSGELLEKP